MNFDKEYKTFKIKKKNGGFREIHAPEPELKRKQREVLRILYNELKPPFFCYGFIPQRNICLNARVHQSKKYVLNVDIKDFFKNCRIENLPEEVKEVLKKHNISPEVLFYKGYLPQGAPTSPFVANFYLKDFDSELFYLLRLHISDDILLSRYADDITISSDSKAIFGNTCLKIIRKVLERYGFEINELKISKMWEGRRKEVTGLCINSGKPTVSRKKRRIIRAAIHNFLKKAKEHQVDIEEGRKIKGWLAFLASVPAHRTEALKKLESIDRILSSFQNKEVKR